MSSGPGRVHSISICHGSTINGRPVRSAKFLVELYLPGGHWEGREYVVRNPTRNDNQEGSFKIRDDGVWSDFALDNESGDLIDLVAMLKNKSKLEAARELRDLLN